MTNNYRDVLTQLPIINKEYYVLVSTKPKNHISYDYIRYIFYRDFNSWELMMCGCIANTNKMYSRFKFIKSKLIYGSLVEERSYNLFECTNCSKKTEFFDDRLLYPAELVLHL